MCFSQSTSGHRPSKENFRDVAIQEDLLTERPPLRDRAEVQELVLGCAEEGDRYDELTPTLCATGGLDRPHRIVLGYGVHRARVECEGVDLRPELIALGVVLDSGGHVGHRVDHDRGGAAVL